MFARLFTAAAFWLATLVPLQASTGIALIIANEDYNAIRDARGASTVLSAVRRLEAAGFRVDLATDLSSGAMQAALSQLSDALRDGEHERVVIVFAGRVIHAGHGTWLMGTDATQPNYASVEAQGVRLATILAMAGQRQGGAVVAIADYGFPLINAPGFNSGLPTEQLVPQGVSVVRGSGPGIADFLSSLALPGVTIGAMADRRADIQLEGFNPPYLTFLPADHQPLRAADRRAWGAALDLNTLAGFEAYLADWPEGDYAALARVARDRLLNTPERVEAALGLSRVERQAIQRDLTILGFDPRGIDGIFGGGTRAAISAWQGASGLVQSGYLNREHVFELAQQGARRAAQLEAEARARQLALERQDRAFWRDTGSGQDEVGLRAYLNRFPEGIFANVAQDRLEQIEAERRAAEAARENTAWSRARNVDTVQGYRAYLTAFPDGEHARQAQRRIQQLTEPAPTPANPLEIAAWAIATSVNTREAYLGYLNAFPNGAFASQARERLGMGPTPPDPLPESPQANAPLQEENALRLNQSRNGITHWQRIERDLVIVGLDPGDVDDTVTPQTRQALRRFQRRNELTVTGYVTQETWDMLRAQARSIRGN